MKEKTLLFIMIGLTLTGFAGAVIIPESLAEKILAHIGGLGVMGLFGVWAGNTAKKKGYTYWKAFSFGFFIPIITGFAALLLVEKGKLTACGGSVSLVTGPFVVLVYSYFGRNRDKKSLKTS